MQKRLLLTVLLISLSGCNTTASKVAQVPAGQWVDEQIVQNATSLSQAQARLHQTSSVRNTAPLTAPAPLPAKVQVPAVNPPIRPAPSSGG